MRPINRALQFLRGAGLRFDWPSSTQWQTSLSAHDPNPPITLESAPIRGVAFDNPGRLKSAGESTVAVNLLLTTLAVVAAAAAPFDQSEWPNPQVRASAQQDAAPNLLTSTLSSAPFRQWDWPVPPVSSARLAEFFPNVALSSPPDAGVPFVPVDLGVPVVVLRAILDAPQNLLTGVLSTEAVAQPFAKYDWVNPQAMASWQFDATMNLLGSTLAAVDEPVIVVVASDWIVRARRRGRR